MKHFTKEELLQAVADGYGTMKELTDMFGLPADYWKRRLAELGVSLEEREPESEQITMNNSSASNTGNKIHK